MKRFPSASTSIPRGPLIAVCAAGSPSAKGPAVPFPATVEMTPSRTFRTRLAVVSAIRRLPDGSIASQVGPTSAAAVAGPPSPGDAVPPPATVVMIPDRPSTRRTTPAALSTMNTLPLASAAMSFGCFIRASVAGPPSPVL
jgi:hypothetical protein